MTMLKRLSRVTAGLVLMLGAGAAVAGEPVVVFTDQSRILEVPRAPGTVVVGNPSIADVTIQGNQVLMHARGYGTTNILILDDDGKYIAEYDVTVQTENDNAVNVYKAGTQFSYVCLPDCQATIHVGDQKDFFNEVTKQHLKRNAIALGQKDGEATAPPEGQPPQ